MTSDEIRQTQFLDREICRITKSTRTTIAAILPLHDMLRQKYSWYYGWHNNNYFSQVHTLILAMIIMLMPLELAVLLF